MFDRQFKLGRKCGGERHCAAPVGISASVVHKSFWEMLNGEMILHFPDTPMWDFYGFLTPSLLSFPAQTKWRATGRTDKLRAEVFFVRPLLLNILTRAPFFDNPSKDVHLRGGLLL